MKRRKQELIAFRLSDEELERLDEMVEQTGMTRSQVIRHLLDNATVKPAIIRTEIAEKKVSNGAS